MGTDSERVHSIRFRNARDAVMKLFGGNQASRTMGSQIVKIRYGKTDVDNLRDQALYAAEAAINKHSASVRKNVEKVGAPTVVCKQLTTSLRFSKAVGGAETR